jgi:NADPH-dependent glutamate synthase beta subunit-like oxidoreductase
MPLELDPRPRAWSEPGRTTREITTGGWRTRRPVWVEATAPCRVACPAGEPIAHWVAAAREGDWARAWTLIREANPMPAVTGRVCAHPCEAACNRGAWDGAVAINALEQFVGDWGLRHGSPAPPAARRPERVAVVGSGPAGLACAYHLARWGYQVCVFEAADALGGMLRHGIPEYRLPRRVLDAEIALILALGVEVRTGRHVGRDLDWRELEAWDAVFIATGAGRPLGLGVPGSDRARSGLEFLREVNRGGRPPLGPRVAVIGGGSTAMDVARTARRLGASRVSVLALEARETMPAAPDEVAQALAEGVEICNHLGIRALREAPGATASLVVAAPARLVQTPDGAIQPAFEPGPEVRLEVDTVLLAVGQEPDLDLLPAHLPRAAGLLAADADGRTPVARIYAGGDVASRRRTVVEALGAGARAARAIHAALAGASLAPPPATPAGLAVPSRRTVAFAQIGTHAFPRAARVSRREREATTRVAGFSEVLLPLDEPAARAEAQRCFSCGRCTGCDVCRQVCPDLAVVRLEGGYRVDDAHCKGCGLCARECPRGALEMADEPWAS